MNKVIYYLETGKIQLKMKSKGLGDTVEKFTKTTGTKSMFNKFTKGDCGCDKRKEKLNQKFPYKNED